MTAALSEWLSSAGYLVIDGVALTDLLPLVQVFGLLQPDPRDGVLVKDIHPQSRDAANTNTLSSRYGLGAFPFHTEAAYLRRPPKFVVLYCMNPGRGARATLVLDSVALFSSLPRYRGEATWLVRAGRRPFLCEALWGCPPAGFGIRYDRECLLPRGPAAQREDALIEGYIASSRPIEIQWMPQRLLLLDNHRMLHGRGDSDVDDRGRWLKRILVA